ncbi:CAZyme family GH5 [Penicillium roqueforti]|uniref:cellulase n=1 Tax=Penicillium roqueforti (strain FM164) TaxID=1365484 RepID=W6Q9U4_PENRF|nr:CAZyme family GH5 [Penicillium roqueforti]CDM33423.1 Glycoside hydrolase, catalytic domain [Penicillium roqueforti FM164]KAF9250849.1 CAZyme family GH5 [Penicillium roqueforti]KAI1830915.1 CAZyme family GH5 [Penicillium roqueforti]KAI2688858.1 CAZyme family GH5 [Penicillium roqueforti]KAI2709640.1 CAZyme family GH5 [Penicillium roqueforti]
MRLGQIAFLAVVAGPAAAVPTKNHAKRASPFQWFGTSESGAEFGEDQIPGVYGTDYIFPDASTIQILTGKGMNIFRVDFLMERLVPDSMTGGFDDAYLSNLTTTVKAITDAGSHAVLDPHNYGRFNGEIISSTSDFQTFWKNVAGEFASNELVIFDTNNEYHDMDQDLVLQLNQAAIDGIREAGATSQYIFVEGNSWTGAWTWVDVNDNLKDLTDPQDKIVYEMHQYLDSDGSGTSEICVSTTIGEERVTDATQWLKDNGKVGVLGEFAGGVNDDCKAAITGMLDYLGDNSDVWLGALWWAAGPWWGDYIFSMEPTTGAAYTGMLSTLEPYLE